ncbi:hypothetical protein N0V88_007522 [Collariella sp. IMI 366227]|nr:hypothetical protein N0V88_007522 [Collariella sp. IMI 366227]
MLNSFKGLIRRARKRVVDNLWCRFMLAQNQLRARKGCSPSCNDVPVDLFDKTAEILGRKKRTADDVADIRKTLKAEPIANPVSQGLIKSIRCQR